MYLFSLVRWCFDEFLSQAGSGIMTIWTRALHWFRDLIIICRAVDCLGESCDVILRQRQTARIQILFLQDTLPDTSPNIAQSQGFVLSGCRYNAMRMNVDDPEIRCHVPFTSSSSWLYWTLQVFYNSTIFGLFRCQSAVDQVLYENACRMSTSSHPHQRELHLSRFSCFKNMSI